MIVDTTQVRFLRIPSAKEESLGHEFHTSLSSKFK